MKYFFRVEYDGTGYGGWQHQTQVKSVQDELERAFATVLRAPCKVTGAGRTDAGVHAAGQGAHIEVPERLTVRSCEHSVNALLPSDIAVYNLQPVDDDFHARYSARSRLYRYRICSRKRPLLAGRAWFVFYKINWDRVHREVARLQGPHDFSAFCAAGSDARHARCTVMQAGITQHGDCTDFVIEANRFVYNMVRSLTGTLVDMGRGKIAATMDELLAGKARAAVGVTAPACGLTLELVSYTGVDA